LATELGDDPAAQVLSRSAGRHPELGTQRLFQSLELPQRTMRVAASGRCGNQFQVCPLVGRIGLGERFPATRQPEQVAIQPAQAFPGLVGPCLVRLVGQQVTDVPAGLTAGDDGIGRRQRRPALRLEFDRIDLDREVR
jgi:hypothetical protein